MKQPVVTLCLIVVLTILQVAQNTYGSPVPQTYQIGPDGRISGGYNTAGTINSASNGLGISDAYSVSANFNRNPGGPVQSSNTHANNLNVAFQRPLDQDKPPGFTYERNPDGTITGSFGFSQAINGPGTNGAFGASQTFSFGPKGSTFGGSQSASLNGNFPGGNNFGFSQTNALSQNQGPNGFGSSGSNSASSQFSNPLFSSSNANANAFANQVNLNNNNNNNNNFNNNFNQGFQPRPQNFYQPPYQNFRNSYPGGNRRNGFGQGK